MMSHHVGSLLFAIILKCLADHSFSTATIATQPSKTCAGAAFQICSCDNAIQVVLTVAIQF